jgi:hypothetical protein
MALGHEIDGVFSWRPWPPLGLVAGYSLLALGDGARAIMQAAGRGTAEAGGTVTPPSLSHLAYLQATLDVP